MSLSSLIDDEVTLLNGLMADYFALLVASHPSGEDWRPHLAALFELKKREEKHYATYRKAGELVAREGVGGLEVEGMDVTLLMALLIEDTGSDPWLGSICPHKMVKPYLRVLRDDKNDFLSHRERARDDDWALWKAAVAFLADIGRFVDRAEKAGFGHPPIRDDGRLRDFAGKWRREIAAIDGRVRDEYDASRRFEVMREMVEQDADSIMRSPRRDVEARECMSLATSRPEEKRRRVLLIKALADRGLPVACAAMGMYYSSDCPFYGIDAPDYEKAVGYYVRGGIENLDRDDLFNLVSILSSPDKCPVVPAERRGQCLKRCQIAARRIHCLEDVNRKLKADGLPTLPEGDGETAPGC